MGVHNMIQMNSTEVSFGEKKIWKFEKKFHDFFRFLKITKSAVWTWPPDIFQIFFSKKLISYLSETFGQKISEVFFHDQTMRFCATLCEISNFFFRPTIHILSWLWPPQNRLRQGHWRYFQVRDFSLAPSRPFFVVSAKSPYLFWSLGQYFTTTMTPPKYVWKWSLKCFWVWKLTSVTSSGNFTISQVIISLWLLSEASKRFFCNFMTPLKIEFTCGIHWFWGQNFDFDFGNRNF